jgi:hypothetical protein
MFKKRNINIRKSISKNQLPNGTNRDDLNKNIRIRTVKKSKMVEMEMEFL